MRWREHADTYRGPPDVPVGEHANRAVHAVDILVDAVEAPNSSAAADITFDVDSRPVGEELRERGSGVAGDTEGHRDGDPCLIELRVLQVVVVLSQGRLVSTASTWEEWELML